MFYYTGVGSRKTPIEILNLMTRIAQKMASLGIVLRSGGAIGADLAFERGAGTLKNIFVAEDATHAAIEIAKRFHPAWGSCRDFVRKLHGRNVFQVLGPDLNAPSPSRGLICWTPDGCKSHSTRCIQTGGTGTAISIASAWGVPVSNLAVPADFEKWSTWVNS